MKPVWRTSPAVDGRIASARPESSRRRERCDCVLVSEVALQVPNYRRIAFGRLGRRGGEGSWLRKKGEGEGAS